jgi:hypothetical protein
VHATIDGRIGDYFEWRTAGRVSSAYGSMQPAVGLARGLLFGTDGRSLFVRVDPFEPGSLDGTTIALRTPAAAGVQFTAGSSTGGLVSALDRVLELSIPLELIAERGAPLRFAVEIRSGDGTMQRIPGDGFVDLLPPDDDPSRFDWSV